MTDIDEFRYNALSRGITLTEKIVKDNVSMYQYVIIEVIIYDSHDGVKFSSTLAMKGDLYGTEYHLDNLRNLVNEIEKAVIKRANTNPNKCNHEIISMYGNKLCKHCYAVLGSDIILSINYN